MLKSVGRLYAPNAIKGDKKMLLEIWLLFAVCSILTFLGGVLYNHFMGRITLFFLSIPFTIMASFGAFQVRVACCGSSAVVDKTYAYSYVGYFFSVILLMTFMFMLVYSIDSFKESDPFKRNIKKY